MKSSLVKVFPSTYRIVQNEGKFTSENNFVNILKSITDMNSYTLSYTGGIVRCVINGYYFEATPEFVNPGEESWFSIVVDNGSKSLVNWSNGTTSLDDEGGTGDFYGLCETSGAPTYAVPTGCSRFVLKVLKDGKLVNSVRLVADSIEYDEFTSIKGIVDEKQYILSAENGIEVNNARGDGKSLVRLKDDEYKKLVALKENTSHDDSRLVYFDTSGCLQSSDLTVGSEFKPGSIYGVSKEMYLNHGVPTEGLCVYAGPGAPEDSGVVTFKNGDIWLKYQK